MRPDVVPPDVIRFIIVPPDTAPFASGGFSPGLAISRDGTQLVYQSTRPDGVSQLSLRPTDQFIAAPLRGTERGTESPLVSPDGKWVAFIDSLSGQVLQKVATGGGPPLTLAQHSSRIYGASWGTDDRIIFGSSSGLFRVSGDGGESVALTTLDRKQGETGHYWPFIIPNREAAVFVISVGLVGSSNAIATNQLAVLDFRTGAVTRLGLAGVCSPHYVSTGHLIYAAEDGSLRAVPFDARSLKLTGRPVPLVEGVRVKTSGAANFNISDNGRLVYALGTAGDTERSLAFVDRNGRAVPLNLPRDAYLSPRLSPDERRLAVQTTGQCGGVIWTYDLSGDRQIKQLTFEGDNHRPIWTPDGSRITFASDRDGTMSLYWQPADGRARAERLTTAAEGERHWPGSWSPDGKVLAFMVQRGTHWGIWTLARIGDAWKPEPLFDVDGRVHMSPEFSPDGKWLAYAAGNSVTTEDVFVEPFPRTGQIERISRNGGYWPFWSKSGDRIFYRPISTTSRNRLRSVDIHIHPDFRFSNESVLAPEGFNVVTYYRDYDVTTDGEKFLMVFSTKRDEVEKPLIHVVLNWFEELRARVPTK